MLADWEEASLESEQVPASKFNLQICGWKIFSILIFLYLSPLTNVFVSIQGFYSVSSLLQLQSSHLLLETFPPD